MRQAEYDQQKRERRGGQPAAGRPPVAPPRRVRIIAVAPPRALLPGSKILVHGVSADAPAELLRAWVGSDA